MIEVRSLLTIFCVCLFACVGSVTKANTAPGHYEGVHYSGDGDTGYLNLLNIARRMFEPDPQYQNLSMLYNSDWNGFVEGPTWGAWWIQNSYGTTYCALPFLQEPYTTFLQNAQDLWFNQMGDGKRVGNKPPFDWIAPDGCLCDCASPGAIIYKQGDGRTAIHDWAVEFTAAGLLLQCELLLIEHDQTAALRYLPKLERCAAFLESRRDKKNNLYLAGPAGNLLAPSFAGYRTPDGKYGMAYLTGLSVTTIAALDRLIEVEKLAGRAEMARKLTIRRKASRDGLVKLTQLDGTLIRSLDPDGVKHGVYGAQNHGYFEASPNHDAVCFRVVDDAQAESIVSRMTSIAGLRPHVFMLPNYPGYDDMYEKPEGLWEYGTWVNGGHWSTCEARMVMAYYRTGRYEDARRSMEQILTFADRFRMDNPLTKEGGDVYQPNQPVNITYDAYGPPTAFMRGLFEYLYRADRLILVPHIPQGITKMRQIDPIRFGSRKLYLATVGSGPVTGVRINGKPWRRFGKNGIQLPYESLPAEAYVTILFGGAKWTSSDDAVAAKQPVTTAVVIDADGVDPAHITRLNSFLSRLQAAGLQNSYEAAHAKLVLDAYHTAGIRSEMLRSRALPHLASEASQKAADQSYVEAADRLYVGLDHSLQRARQSASDSAAKRAALLWEK